MALSAEYVNAHVEHWSQKLRSEFFPHRKYWPTRLFHHAPIENALAILREGCLRARADRENCHPRDVAAPGVINTRDHAHGRVRLYFRPKTPTQYSIEGIRKAGECQYGETTHLPIIVMFAFDSKKILLKDDVEFSDRNMQLNDASVGNDEQFFAQIDFEKVYHEGNIGGNREIIDCRCAEVMHSSPLDLHDCLEEIFFRSKAERDTLLYRLGEVGNRWNDICYVSDALKVFQKDYSFVDHIELKPDGLVFKLNPRRDHNNVKVRIVIEVEAGQKFLDVTYDSLLAKPPGGGNWIAKVKLEQGRYLVKLWIEDHLAFENLMSLESELL